MPKIQKLTILGGGSTYTPELLSGFIEHQDKLHLGHISLYDIHPERLSIVGNFVRRMFQHAGLSGNIELTQDLSQAVEGADFVVSQIRVGWMAARILDERIPLRYNVLGQETVGAGGIFKALRTIPVTLDFAQVIARLAPKAWFLNFTNPSGIITEALIKHSELEKVVGLCNVPINSHKTIARLLGVRPEEIWLDWLGLNHLGWIRRIDVGGRDHLLEILAMIPDHPLKETSDRFPFDESLLSTLGLLPTYYLHYYYETPKIVADIQEAGNTRGEIVAEIEQSLIQIYRDSNQNTKPEELQQRGGAFYSEAAIQLMISLLTDQRDVQILIVKNNGAISGLPDDVAVEVPAIVGAHGVTPLVRGAPPIQVRNLLESIKTSDILTIEAGVTGSRQKAIQALQVNPLVPSYEMAEILTDELLKAHQNYLPKFFPTLEQTAKTYLEMRPT